MILVSMPTARTPRRYRRRQRAAPDEGGGADVVKMQGGREKAPIIRAIADAGVP